MQQCNLFTDMSNWQIWFDQFIKNVQLISNKVVKEMEYPNGSVVIYENRTKTEINYPVQIREARRTQIGDNEIKSKTIVSECYEGVRLNYICTPIVTIVKAKNRSKNSDCVILRLGVSAFQAVQVPKAQEIKEIWVKRDKQNLIDQNNLGEEENGSDREKVLTRYDVYIPHGSTELLPYLEDLIHNRLLNYKSSEPSYGCCHLYQQCSDAKRCVSKDKMYATVCSYKRNLESGRIFYGKNKNIIG